MGGKTRFAKQILPIILKDRKPNQYYVEPFCGGLGTLSEVHGNRIGGDINPFLIAMWKGVQAKRKRRTKIPKSLYDRAKAEYLSGELKDFDLFQIGWIGLTASYRGRMYGGYGIKDKNGRNYLAEHIRSIREQAKGLDGLMFYNCNYWELRIPKNSIIYCDPPYEGTTGYNKEAEFDHKKFWNWCRRMSKKGHQVFISEYKAPSDFKCVWKMKITNRINHANTEMRLERLFVYKPTWKRKDKIKIKKLF